MPHNTVCMHACKLQCIALVRYACSQLHVQAGACIIMWNPNRIACLRAICRVSASMSSDWSLPFSGTRVMPGRSIKDRSGQRVAYTVNTIGESTIPLFLPDNNTQTNKDEKLTGNRRDNTFQRDAGPIYKYAFSFVIIFPRL